MIGKDRYPIGQQSFEVLRRCEQLYVDKTMFVEKIIDSGERFFFLGRPRRFGKSLFLSTLKCFFQGKRDLFRGLHADGMDWDWQPYPVLLLDLNAGDYSDPRQLDSRLNATFDRWERDYGVSTRYSDPSLRMEELIVNIHRVTGREVVVLVDEYDKPLVNSIRDRVLMDEYRRRLAAVYANFKSCSDHIRLVFLTGVSRFARLSVFSGLNNLRDISLSNEYSDICGITGSELTRYFSNGISAMAEHEGKDTAGVLEDIRIWYDGYRFSGAGKEIYNPFSLLNMMADLEFRNYWIQSGNATLLAEQLRSTGADLRSFLNSECSLDELAGGDLDTISPAALFYQTGYLTIKKYDPRFRTATLGLPNKEVTQGFLTYLMPLYVSLHDGSPDRLVRRIVADLEQGRPDDFMTWLRSFFAGISYEMRMDDERNVHNALLVLMKLLGLYVKEEYRTSDGRIDLFIAAAGFYYIVEIKLDAPASEALDQINSKEYALPFATEGRRVVKIGVSFSSARRTLSEWIVER